MDNDILPLPDGYTARPGCIEDYKLVVDLLNAHSQHLNGCDDLKDPELLRIDWLNEGFNPQVDVRLVLAGDGSPVAFVECWLNQHPPVHPWIFGCVHPTHWGRGIGGYLLTWAKEHARLALDKCEAHLRVAPRSGAEAHNTAGLALYEGLGWKNIRSFYRMVADLDSTPQLLTLPVGITIRTYNPEIETEAVYHAFVDSFRDHFGFIEQPFEKGFAEFKHNLINEPGYDARLWFVAVEGDEIVGVCICRGEDPEDAESGWVNELGVRRAWRKRGIGNALLKHAFAAFQTNGKKRAGLGVDASSLTGALKLYESAGMRVLREFKMFEKELRAGMELAVESL